MQTEINKFYDLDLPYGHFYEKKLAEILAGKIEVKTEREIWKTTGNLDIEIYDKGKESGLNITTARYWAHIIPENDGTPKQDDIRVILLFPVTVLKRLVKECENKELKYGGDNKETLNALIPLSEVLDYKKYIHGEM